MTSRVKITLIIKSFSIMKVTPNKSAKNEVDLKKLTKTSKMKMTLKMKMT